MSGDSIEVQVAKLGTKMEAYHQGQMRIESTMQEIARSMSMLVEMRAGHDRHSDEIKALRERVHDHGNRLIGAEHLIDGMKDHGKRLRFLERSEPLHGFISGWTFKILIALPSITVVTVGLKFLLGS